MIELIKIALDGKRFDLQNEKKLQQEVADALRNGGVFFHREHKLSDKSIIDFFVPIFDRGIGLELKISGSPKSIYKQLERYCEFPQVHEIVLITNKTIGLPSAINGKSTHIINLGKAWL